MSISLPHLPVRARTQEEFNRQIATTVNQLIRRFVAAAEPGALQPFAGASAPTGWLLCNGTALSRTDYADLFAAIGTTWGAGDGLTTFNIPDLRDKLLIGANTVVSLGGSSGALTAMLAVNNLPSHSHSVSDAGHTHTFTGVAHSHAVTDAGHSHGVTDAGHTHNITDPGHTHSDAFVDDAAGTEYVNAAGDKGTAQTAIASATTGITVDNATTGLTVNNATTGVSVNNATATGTNSTAGTGITLGDTGGGSAFSILPPVAGINWIIKT